MHFIPIQKMNHTSHFHCISVSSFFSSFTATRSPSSKTTSPPQPFSHSTLNPSSSTALDLPEILERVFYFLDQFTLHHSCNVVCRQWFSVTKRLAFPRHKFTWTQNTLPDSLLLDLSTTFHIFDAHCHALTTCKRLEAIMLANNVNLDEPRLGSAENRAPLAMALPVSEFYFQGCINSKRLHKSLGRLGMLTVLHITVWHAFSDICLHHGGILVTCPMLVDLLLEASDSAIPLIVRNPSQRLFSPSIRCGQDPTRLTKLLHQIVPRKGLLKLESLILRRYNAHVSLLVDILASSPRLQQLSLNKWGESDMSCYGEAWFLDFLAISCPHLRRVHFSLGINTLQISSLEQLLTRNRKITGLTLNRHDLTPSLLKHLSVVPNVLTFLEISSGNRGLVHHAEPESKHLEREPYSRTIEDQISLHSYLCQSPLLLHLHAHCVTFSVLNIKLFGEDLNGFENAHQLWACRNLKSLSIHVCIHAVDNCSTPIRTIFGYLSRVCPRLQRLRLWFDDCALDLQSGICLLSRMQELQVLQLYFPFHIFEHSNTEHWREMQILRTLDVSWMASKGKLSAARKIVWQANVAKWYISRLKENRIIGQREAYLAEKGKREGGMDVLGSDIKRPWSHLGTSLDVENCLKELMAERGCWPRLERVHANAHQHPRGPNLVEEAVEKVRPGVTRTGQKKTTVG